MYDIKPYETEKMYLTRKKKEEKTYLQRIRKANKDRKKRKKIQNEIEEYRKSRKISFGFPTRKALFRELKRGKGKIFNPFG